MMMATTSEMDSLDPLFNRAEHLAETRPERLRLHLNLVDLMVRQIRSHVAAGRGREAAAAWTTTLECFVEDTDQKFTVDAWEHLAQQWPSPQRHALGFREPGALPTLRTD